MATRQPERQLTEFIAKFAPEMSKLIRAARAKMRGFVPQALELVYDNDNFLVIGYGPSEKSWGRHLFARSPSERPQSLFSSRRKAAGSTQAIAGQWQCRTQHSPRVRRCA
jgi:hypothetical protein